MKKISFLVLLCSLVGFASGEDAPETLNDLFDRRIKVNEKYRDEFTREAADLEFAKQLVPLEKELGQEWVDYLKYVKSLKDDVIRKQVLRMEILEELTGSYSEAQWPEDDISKMQALADIRRWKTELEFLDRIVGKKNVKTPKTLDDLLDRQVRALDEKPHAYTEAYEDDKYAKIITPLENELNRLTVENLKAVKASKDKELKKRLLRISILVELSTSYYDAEYAGGSVEKAKAGGAIQRWKRELSYLDQIGGKPGKKEKPAAKD